MEQEFLIIPDELLISKIYLFREKKVMFDRVPVAIGKKSIRKAVKNQDERVEMIYNYLIKFIKQEQKPRTPIGF
ncbi:MAG: hypothetical protein ACK5B9_12595 [Flavobacteriia bacterium]|jgi:phosphopantetheine adenylyltransferase